MKEEETIKEYLKSIKFSTNKGYVDLIHNYIKFKEVISKPKENTISEITKGVKK